MQKQNAQKYVEMLLPGGALEVSCSPGANVPTGGERFLSPDEGSSPEGKQRIYATRAKKQWAAGLKTLWRGDSATNGTEYLVKLLASPTLKSSCSRALPQAPSVKGNNTTGALVSVKGPKRSTKRSGIRHPCFSHATNQSITKGFELPNSGRQCYRRQNPFNI